MSDNVVKKSQQHKDACAAMHAAALQMTRRRIEVDVVKNPYPYGVHIGFNTRN